MIVDVDKGINSVTFQWKCAWLYVERAIYLAYLNVTC
jgi:hypothetical protein